MALALEGVDLVAFAGVMLLIGLLVATRYTFERLAGVLDTSILGTHPFRGIADSIRGTIIAGLNDGIDALQDVARDLWHWGAVSFNIMLDGIVDTAHALERSWKWLQGTGLTHAIQAITGPIAARAEQAWNYADSTFTSVVAEVKRLDAKIASTAAAIVSQYRGEIREAVLGVEADVAAKLSTIESDIRKATADVLGQAELAGQHGIDELRRAEDAAIGAATAAETATAGELRDLLNNLDPAAVAGLLASIPIVTQLVRTLERESGLESPECRTKVKGICGTPSTSWLRMLAGLAVAVELADIHELLGIVERLGKEITHEVERLVA